MSDSFDQTIRVGLADLASNVTAEAESRVLTIDYIPQAARRRRLRTAWATGSAALTAGAATTAVVLLASAGSVSLSPLTGVSYSLAGWTSIPGAAGTPRLQAATKSCDRTIATFAESFARRTSRSKRQASGFTISSSMIASVQNVLTDLRGKYVALVALDRNAPYVCINGDAARQGTVTFRDKTIPAPPRAGQLSSARVVHLGGVGYVNGVRVTGLEAGNHAYGRAGDGVTAVLLGFRDGRTVSATVQHGWYFAWWPWGSTPSSIQITNTKGTFRSTTSCTPGSSGCVLSSNQTNP